MYVCMNLLISFPTNVLFYLFKSYTHQRTRYIGIAQNKKKKKRSVYAKTLPPPPPLLVKTIENYILITDSIEEF